MSARSSQNNSAFTLVEMVLALGLTSIFLVGIITIMSSGITSSSEASNDSRLSLIVQDVANRVRGVEFLKDSQNGVVSAIPNQYYSRDGRWLDQTDADQAKENAYLAVVKKGKPATQPANANMMAVVVEIYWPVNQVPNGDALPAGVKPDGSNANAKFSTMVAPWTGKGWKDIDSTYIPKIEG